MNAYDLLRDFAGPIATILASLAAATVAVILALRQARSAERQADIAYAKLKSETYEDRYKIYKSISELLYTSAHLNISTDEEKQKFYELLSTVDEGIFLFRPATVSFMKEVINKIRLLSRTRGRYERLDHDSPKRNVLADQIDEITDGLELFYSRLSSVFEEELSLQLPSEPSLAPLLPDWAALIIIAFLGSLLISIFSLAGVIK